VDAERETPDYRDLTEWVVIRILNAIKQGSIEQGERLVERDIAERFDVSRAPVRDAFHALERIGVVERRHPRGICVRAWSEHDAIEILYLMDALIFMSIKLAAGRLTEEDYAALEDILTRTATNMESAAVDRGYQLSLDIKFHQIIARRTGHRRLNELLDRLTLPIELWPEAFLQRVVPAFSYRQHTELLAALRTNDSKVAVDCVIRHQQETDALELALFGRSLRGDSDAAGKAAETGTKPRRRRASRDAHRPAAGDRGAGG